MLRRILSGAALGAALLYTPILAAAQDVPQHGDTLRLSIEDAVARAQRLSDAARSARAQADVAAAQLDLARATALPSLRITGGYTHTYASARAAAVSSQFLQTNSYTLGGTFNQPLFQGGRELFGIRAASRLRAAARLTEEDARTAAGLDAQRAYLLAILAGRLVDIQRSNLQLASNRVTQAEQLQSGGRAARYDVLRARVERANAEPLVLQSESDREIALLQLKQLLKVPLDQPVALTSRLDGAAVGATLASYAADTVDAMLAADARPSVRAALLTARARRDVIGVSRADFLPTISAFVTGGVSAFPVSGFPPIRGQRDTTGVNGCAPASGRGFCYNGGFFKDLAAGVQLTWNVFDIFRVHGNVDLARAQANLAEIEYDRQRQAAALEIAQASAELKRARSFFQARQQASSEAQETFRLASLRYDRGLGTQLDVSDAQLAQLTAETNEARAAVDLYLATAELAYALGRPIPFPPSAPSPARATSTSSLLP
ncbi:MAG TPA: TolC family protein [Gemmatimonadaceae bacterium]